LSRILVTGARGLLGSELVPLLRASDHEVIEHARCTGADAHADLSDAVQCAALLDLVAPQTIVNLVALTDVDACERDPQRAYLSNVRSVENLAGWLRRGECRCHLVHVSTDQVYDGAGPHDEADVTLRNYYAFSKYAGELATAGTNATVLRTNFFGPSRSASRSSFSDWLISALSSSQAISVFDDVLFSPLSLSRLAAEIGQVIARPLPGVFNLGSREGMSKADFAFALAAELGLPVAAMRRAGLDSARLPVRRPNDMRMNCRRYESTFGVELPTLRREIQSMRGSHAQQAG
jgi:dTDP-4-dehydrorhamnose reductase